MINLPIWDVGFELEVFLTDGKSGVYNANKVMTDRLGFSIDQNSSMTGEIKPCKDYTLKTDGTPIELQWFREYNGGSLDAEWVKTLQAIKPLNGLTLSTVPYLKTGDDQSLAYKVPVHFIDPGTIYASGKTIYNAYTGGFTYSAKKEGPTKVTIRTAGLHLHFSISKKLFEKAEKFDDKLFGEKGKYGAMNNKTTDLLVRTLDDIYTNTIRSGAYFSSQARLRENFYQTLGNYRIKCDTITGLRTIEYRQLPADIARDMPRLQKFIDVFQYVSLPIIRKVVGDKIT